METFSFILNKTKWASYSTVHGLRPKGFGCTHLTEIQDGLRPLALIQQVSERTPTVKPSLIQGHGMASSNTTLKHIDSVFLYEARDRSIYPCKKSYVVHLR